MSSPDSYSLSPAWGGSPYGYVPYQFTPSQPVLGGTPLLTLPPTVPLQPLLQNVQVKCMFGGSQSDSSGNTGDGGRLDVYAK